MYAFMHLQLPAIIGGTKIFDATKIFAILIGSSSTKQGEYRPEMSSYSYLD